MMTESNSIPFPAEELSCRAATVCQNQASEKTPRQFIKIEACRGADSTRSVDLSNMSIKKAAVPKDETAAY